MFDFSVLAKQTPGYVGADLVALTAEAGMQCVNRIFEKIVTREVSLMENDISGVAADEMEIDAPNSSDTTTVPLDESPANKVSTIITKFLSSQRPALTPDELVGLTITYQDFTHALKKVQPSAKREGFATIPGVSWDDIGALESVRQELRMAVVEPIKYPEAFTRVGITKPMGVLLYGPPGCGKTLLAKAVANESCCNFISVKGPELLNKVRVPLSSFLLDVQQLTTFS